MRAVLDRRLTSWQGYLAAYIAWFLITEVALVQVVEHRVGPDWLGVVWYYLHFAVNPWLAGIVAVAGLAQVPQVRWSRGLLIIVLAVPILAAIAYLGLSRSGRWMEVLGVRMR